MNITPQELDKYLQLVFITDKSHSDLVGEILQEVDDQFMLFEQQHI